MHNTVHSGHGTQDTALRTRPAHRQTGEECRGETSAGSQITEGLVKDLEVAPEGH